MIVQKIIFECDFEGCSNLEVIEHFLTPFNPTVSVVAPNRWTVLNFKEIYCHRHILCFKNEQKETETT